MRAETEVARVAARVGDGEEFGKGPECQRPRSREESTGGAGVPRSRVALEQTVRDAPPPRRTPNHRGFLALVRSGACSTP